VRHQARVLHDATAGTSAWVSLDGVAACQRCASGQGCGAGLFNQGSRPVRLECHTPDAVLANQAVVVEHETGGSGWLWMVAGAYGLPTSGMLVSCLLADAFLPGSGSSGSPPGVPGTREWLTGLLSLAGLAGGVIAWRCLAPFMTGWAQTGPCLQSARIVAVAEPSTTSSRESRHEA